VAHPIVFPDAGLTRVVVRALHLAPVALGCLLAACSASVSEPEHASPPESYPYAAEDDPLRESLTRGCGDCDPPQACAQLRPDVTKDSPERDRRALCETRDRDICNLDPGACQTSD
jgi:hypothetical protein